MAGPESTARSLKTPSPDAADDVCMENVIRFASEADAETGCAAFTRRGHTSEVQAAPDGDAWLVVALKWVPQAGLGTIYDDVTAVVEELGGTWEKSQVAAMK
jgi:hypothetical protein